MKRLRILFPYIGDSVGGSHHSSILLGEAIKKNHDIVYGLQCKDGPLAEFMDSRGLPYIMLPKTDYLTIRPTWRQWRKRSLVRKNLSPLLIRHGFDFVHTHDTRNHATWSEAVQVCSTKHVWHQRTPVDVAHFAKWASRADAIISVSEFTNSTLPNEVRELSKMIYNPFITECHASKEFQMKLKYDLDLPKDAILVGFVANFAERKRPGFFVDIADEVLRQSSLPIYFLMFGEPYEPCLSEVRGKIDKYQLADRVLILGRRHPFSPVMAGLSVLVTPARNEALGRTMIEACLCGVPNVASDDGGNREIILHGETGWLVPVDSRVAFAESIIQSLIDSSESARRTRNAKLRAQETFSLETHLEHILRIYEELV